MEGDATRIVSRSLEFLAEPFAAHEDDNPDGEAYVAMLREIAKMYMVCDLVEEFCMCGVYPVQAGWEVKH